MRSSVHSPQGARLEIEQEHRVEFRRSAAEAELDDAGS
jgi:hypothetical protein